MMLCAVLNFARALTINDVFHNVNSTFYVNPAIKELKLAVKRSQESTVNLVISGVRQPMERIFQDSRFNYYQCTVAQLDATTSYYFVIKVGADSLRFPAIGELLPNVPLFYTPKWAQGMTYYVIYPDGFYNSTVTNDPAEKCPWGTPPRNWRSYGGDLKGITQKMAYIDTLDPDIILLRPIFKAPSNHKLNTTDYARIDSSFGDTITLKRLIDEFHGRGLKVVLSVVFTHTGTDFATFTDVVKNGHASKYANWYQIRSLPIKTAPPSYECWRSDYRFPKLNLTNQQVRNYLIGYLEYWKHFGFDGFYIGEDEIIEPSFARALRNHFKNKYPEILLLGSDQRLIMGSAFDGCGSQAAHDMMISYFIKETMSTSQFDQAFNQWLFFNPPQSNAIHLLYASDCNMRAAQHGTPDQLRLLYAFLFTTVGSPALLYGEEVGLAECTPLNPASFPWESSAQNRSLLQDIRALIQIRKANPQIRSNRFYTLYVNDITGVYAYDRGGIVVVLNTGDRDAFVELPAWDGVYLDLVTGEHKTAFSQKLKLSVSAKTYSILKREI